MALAWRRQGIPAQWRKDEKKYNISPKRCQSRMTAAALSITELG
jgi:hypothetical protein